MPNSRQVSLRVPGLGRLPRWEGRDFPPGRAVLPALIVAAVWLSGTATAQYDIRPFEDDPVAISAAFGVELAVLRLEAIAALLDSEVDEDEIEELVDGLELDFVRFAAALRRVDSGLLDRVNEALETLEESEQLGAEDVSEGLLLLREARDVVSTPLLHDPAYTAALMSLLLVSESGVAEGWEEAVEGEVGPYAVSWAGMSRLWELWRQVESLANENQRFEIEDQLGELQVLFEEPVPPDMAGADPEAGEDPAVRVAGFLEDVTGAWLFPDRDLASLLTSTKGIAVAGCASYEDGDELLGDAHLAWVGIAFAEYLAGTLQLFAPEPTERLQELLSGVVVDDDDDAEPDGEGSGRGSNEDDDVVVEVGFDPASCEQLLEELDAAGAPLGL